MNWFSKAEELYSKSLSGTIGSSELDEIIAWPMEELPLLFASADKVRRNFFNDSVNPCTLMNIKSGGCSEDCSFCAQSAHNAATVTQTELASIAAIREQCNAAAKNNLPFCVVSSGRRMSHDEVKHIAEALTPCKNEKHASLGILDDADFTLLKEAGVTCYNHNLETNRSFFPKVVSTHTYDERIATVKSAQKAGMHVCCGGIFGLGETWKDRKEFCLTLAALKVDTVPINFLNAIPGTRAKPPVETPLEFLKIVSLFRLCMPNQTIKVCGGREVNLGPLQSLIFFAGANGYVTDGYLTTAGAGLENDDAMIRMLGLQR